MKRKARAPEALSSITSEPVMSVGIRSGVNWMRLVSSPSTMRQRFHQLGLGQAGHADQKAMAARHQGHQGLLDHVILAEDHFANAPRTLVKVSAAFSSRGRGLRRDFGSWDMLGSLRLARDRRYVAPLRLGRRKPGK